MFHRRIFIAVLAALSALAVAGSALADGSINVASSRVIDQLQRDEHHDFAASRSDNVMPPQANLFDHASERYQQVQEQDRVGE
jgi:hypothetical protein